VFHCLSKHSDNIKFAEQRPKWVVVVGGGEKRSVHALKNWVMSVLELYGAQQSVVKGCCEHGNERRDSENFLIIFMSIIFSRNALCHRTAYQVQK